MKQREQTIHIILAGLFLKGFIQGQTGKIDDSVLDFAKKELNKLFLKDKEEIK